MLWTLLKVVVFLCLVSGLAFGAEFLAEATDHVTLVFAGTEYVIPPLVAVVMLAIAVLAIWLLIKATGALVAVLRFINGDETALSRYFDRNRESKGFTALTNAMLALSSGDGVKAKSYARKAQKLLNRPELTNLVIAQAAERTGDLASADQAYREMLTDERTRFAGVQGLLQRKLSAGESDLALKLAEKAIGLEPKHKETQATLLRLYAANEDWAGARKTLTAQLKAGTITKDVHRRRFAVLTTAQAQDALALGKVETARDGAFEASRLAPDLVPAAVLAARMHIEAGATRKATSVIKGAWAKTPHADLATAFAEIAPDETSAARLKRFAPLLKKNPEHAESRMINAELRLAVDDVEGARAALGDLATAEPTARSLTIMAAIEKASGAEDHLVRAWLTRAASASRGPVWLCSNCGTEHESWAPVCSACEGFDLMEWTTPRHFDAPSAQALGNAHLQLLEAKPETAIEPVTEDADVIEDEGTQDASKDT